MPQVPIHSRLSSLTDAEPFKDRTRTMERRIWDLLPTEENVVALKAYPLTTQQIYLLLPVAYRSIRRALNRMRQEGRLFMERDGKEFMYAQKTGAMPPLDGRGGAR